MSKKHRGPRQVGKRLHNSFVQKKVRKHDVIAALMRRAKRDLISRGIIQDSAQRSMRYKFTWTYGNLNGVVYADGRSEARALIKKDLGIRRKNRLPIEVKITRENNDEDDTTGSIRENSNSHHRRSKTCPTI